MEGLCTSMSTVVVFIMANWEESDVNNRRLAKMSVAEQSTGSLEGLNAMRQLHVY